MGTEAGVASPWKAGAGFSEFPGVAQNAEGRAKASEPYDRNLYRVYFHDLDIAVQELAAIRAEHGKAQTDIDDARGDNSHSTRETRGQDEGQSTAHSSIRRLRPRHDVPSRFAIRTPRTIRSTSAPQQ